MIFLCEYIKTFKNGTSQDLLSSDSSPFQNIKFVAQATGLIKPRAEIYRNLSRNEALAKLCVKALKKGKSDLAIKLAKFLDDTPSLNGFCWVKHLLSKALRLDDGPLIQYISQRIHNIANINYDEIFSLKDADDNSLLHWACLLKLPEVALFFPDLCHLVRQIDFGQITSVKNF